MDQIEVYRREFDSRADMESQKFPECFTYPIALEITFKKRFHEANWRREESSSTGALQFWACKRAVREDVCC